MDIPTVGVGKTVFAVDGITQIKVKEACALHLHKGGDAIDLKGDSGKTWGVAMRSSDDSKNPVIISQGHRISLPTAISVVKAVTKTRIPEPIRNADLRSRKWVKEIYDTEKSDKPSKKQKQKENKQKQKEAAKAAKEGSGAPEGFKYDDEFC
jgi:hypothetical protein